MTARESDQRRRGEQEISRGNTQGGYDAFPSRSDDSHCGWRSLMAREQLHTDAGHDKEDSERCCRHCGRVVVVEGFWVD
jgi:hypothetical protein